MSRITFFALGNISDEKGPHVLSMGLRVNNGLINSFADGVPGGTAQVYVDEELVDTVDLGPKIAYNVNKFCPAGIGSTGRVDYKIGDVLVAQAFVSDMIQGQNANFLGGSTYLNLGGGYREVMFVAIGDENFSAEDLSFGIAYAYGIPIESLTAVEDRDGNVLYHYDQNANNITDTARMPRAYAFDVFTGWSDNSDLSPINNATLMTDRGASGAVMLSQPYAAVSSELISAIGDDPSTGEPDPTPAPAEEKNGVTANVLSFVGGFLTSKVIG